MRKFTVNRPNQTDTPVFKRSQLTLTEFDIALIHAVAPWAKGSCKTSNRTLRRSLYLLLPIVCSGYIPSPCMLHRLRWPYVRRSCLVLANRLSRDQAEQWQIRSQLIPDQPDLPDLSVL